MTPLVFTVTVKTLLMYIPRCGGGPMDPEQTETMSVEEFHGALNSIHADILASHLLLMEEIRSIQEEMFDSNKETKRFLDHRREAATILQRQEKSASTALANILARRKGVQ
ncbi:hypothetical protein GSbR_37200 [Geobacter sp. SVR]|nr:hypothetical protein GSVR_28280 [Geobacter sp. SVR]GCF87120.1 hypothetical protein GSbR_37200 [Geobacter sp. SVR]